MAPYPVVSGLPMTKVMRKISGTRNVENQCNPVCEEVQIFRSGLGSVFWTSPLSGFGAGTVIPVLKDAALFDISSRN
jgi:hypothetical protein